MSAFNANVCCGWLVVDNRNDFYVPCFKTAGWISERRMTGEIMFGSKVLVEFQEFGWGHG